MVTAALITKKESAIMYTAMFPSFDVQFNG